MKTLVAVVALYVAPASMPSEPELRDRCYEAILSVEMKMHVYRRRGVRKEQAIEEAKNFSSQFGLSEAVTTAFIDAIYDEKMDMGQQSRAFTEECVTYLKKHPELFEEKKKVSI